MLLLAMALIQADIMPPLDTPAQRAVAEQPLVELFSYEDYPPDALSRDAQGRVRVRLMINPQGRAQTCQVLTSSDDESLDATTCDVLLERSRFRPARNADGDAVPDFVETQVRWALPDPRMPFEAARFGAVLRNRPGGPDCFAVENGEEQSEPIEHCYQIFGPQVLLLSERDVLELRFEMRIAPARETSTDPPLDMAGEVLWHYAGEITAAPNGTVSRCSVARNDAGENFPLDIAARPNPCAFWLAAQFEERDSGRDLRQARFEGVFLAIRGSGA